MSFAPPATARSLSWCTSWKSRVASAEATTNVGVTSMTSGGRVTADSGRQAGSVRSSSILTNSARTGRPIRTWPGAAPSSSPVIRTPSGSWTSATTMGSFLPGTGG